MNFVLFNPNLGPKSQNKVLKAREKRLIMPVVVLVPLLLIVLESDKSDAVFVKFGAKCNDDQNISNYESSYS